jgi:protein tyrosine phosphatase (PTP) superfamily phosphohydrolase (DUF442 family)
MTTNTIKTLFGFARSVLNTWTPFKAKSDSISDIYNYLPIDNLFSTSGQPSEAQFAVIREEGFETVINLAPTSVLENSVVNESEILAALGMRYIHIPVDFKKPTDDDFGKFTTALEGKDCRRVWVHCAANMRVSAFTYRYRRYVLGEDGEVANADLQKIWEPIGVWKAFLKQ